VYVLVPRSSTTGSFPLQLPFSNSDSEPRLLSSHITF
jgi:hypothetical protein